jgi:hypothetical protein
MCLSFRLPRCGSGAGPCSESASWGSPGDQLGDRRTGAELPELLGGVERDGAEHVAVAAGVLHGDLLLVP